MTNGEYAVNSIISASGNIGGTAAYGRKRNSRRPDPLFPRGFKNTPQSEIEKCLNCKRAVCNGCEKKPKRREKE